jgi:hypothetical protein
MRVVTGQPLGFTPHAISQNGQNRKFFGLCGLEKPAGSRFYQESARAKTENGNSPANALGLLGRIAARLVRPLLEP